MILKFFKKYFFLVLISMGMACVLSGALTGAAFAAGNNESELFLVAQKAFDDGFFDVAIRYIDQLFQQYPQTDKRIQARLLLGQCHFFKSEYLKAYDIFQKLADTESQFKDASLFWLGETYLKGSDHKQAEAQYQKIIETYPQSLYASQAYYSLGWSFYDRNDYDEALNIFLKFLAKYPDHQLSEDAAFKVGEILYNVRKYEEVIGHFQKYITHYLESTKHAQAYFYIAESYYYLEQPLDAVVYYAKAAELSYDNKIILLSKLGLGWSYLKLGKYQLAQEHFQFALDLANSKNLDADDVLFGLAMLSAEQKQYKEAHEYYTQLIGQYEHSTRAAEAFWGRANVYYAQQQYDQAVRDYRVVIDRYQDQPQKNDIVEKAYFGLAWSYLKAGQTDLAMHTFRTVEGRATNKTVKVSALTQIGDAYQDIGEFEKAVEIYDQILTTYPEIPVIDYVQYRQGIALLKMEKLESAALSFQILQANFPNSKYLTDMRYYLAVAYFKQGDWTAAQEKISQFLKDVPSTHILFSEANYILGLTYFNAQKYDQAISVFLSMQKQFSFDAEIVQNAELYLAKSYYFSGNIKEGIRRMKLLLEKNQSPSLTQEILVLLGDHYAKEEDFDYALQYYRKFLKDFPGSSQRDTVFYQLGQIYRRKGNWEEAVEMFKNISAKNDPALWAQSETRIAEIFTHQMDAESAVKTYENIAKTNPEFAKDAMFNMAKVTAQRQQDRKRAIELAREAMKVQQGRSQTVNAQIQFFIADLYDVSAEDEIAVEEYLKIPYLFAGHRSLVVKAYLRVARIFENQENWPEAQKIYQKIRDLNVEESKFAQERLDWISVNSNPGNMSN